MLCVSADSQCDVCSEPFDEAVRVPCSIECGHVFCRVCLQSLLQPQCPLCRRYSPESKTELPFTRLIIDVGHTGASKDPDVAHADEDAQNFLKSITSVANNGATEQELITLIRECKAFLHSQPREKFMELRVCHRMLKYIFDYKTDARGKQYDLQGQLAAATQKHERLLERIQSYKESVKSLEHRLDEERQQRISALRSVEIISEALKGAKEVAHIHKEQPVLYDYPDSPTPEYAMSPLPELSSLASLPIGLPQDQDPDFLGPAIPLDIAGRHWQDHDEASDSPDSSWSTPAIPPPSLPSSYHTDAMHFPHDSKRTTSPSRSRRESNQQENGHRPRSNSKVVHRPEYQEDQSESLAPRPTAYQPVRAPISHASIAAQKHSTLKEKRRSSEGVNGPDSAGSNGGRLLSSNYSATRASFTRNNSYSRESGTPDPVKGSTPRRGVIT